MTAPTLMSPEDFNASINPVIDAVKVIADAPLNEMLAYVEHVEKWGEAHPDKFSPERATSMRSLARLLSASVFVRNTVKMGGGALT